MKAAANTAREVATAGTTKPLNGENAMIAVTMNTTEASGKPRRLAKIDAKVCSCHVTGSQYGT